MKTQRCSDQGSPLLTAAFSATLWLMIGPYRPEEVRLTMVSQKQAELGTWRQFDCFQVLVNFPKSSRATLELLSIGRQKILNFSSTITGTRRIRCRIVMQLK